MSNINWDSFNIGLWSPEKEVEYEMILGFWKQETRSYDDNKTQKPVLVFDVLKVNGEEFAQGKKQFVTGASSFTQAVKPMIIQAEATEKQAIAVNLKYSKDKRYTVTSLSPQKTTEDVSVSADTLI